MSAFKGAAFRIKIGVAVSCLESQVVIAAVVRQVNLRRSEQRRRTVNYIACYVGEGQFVEVFDLTRHVKDCISFLLQFTQSLVLPGIFPSFAGASGTERDTGNRRFGFRSPCPW